MKTPFISALAFAAAFSLVPLSAPALAQDNQTGLAEQSEAESQDQTQSWKNPERIADIEDEDARIRAFSVLIGQSVYDEMLGVDAAQEGGDDTSGSDDGSADAGQSDSEASSDDTAASDDAMAADESASSDTAQDDAAGNAVSEGLTVQVINISALLSRADVLALELLAEQNEQELLPLQSVLSLDEQSRSALEEEGLVPADVVGIQRTSDTLDIFVIPDWLNE